MMSTFNITWVATWRGDLIDVRELQRGTTNAAAVASMAEDEEEGGGEGKTMREAVNTAGEAGTLQHSPASSHIG